MHAPARLDLEDLVAGAPLGDHVGVGQLHPLGRPGGAGGVDQAEHVVGLDRAPGGLEVELRLAHRLQLGERDRPRRRLAVDDDHVLERRHPLARLQHRSRKACSVTITRLAASPTRYSTCSGEEVL